MKPAITASMLYDWVQCPHRVYLDLFGDPTQKEEVSSFVKLLWEKGNKYEKQTIQNIGIPFVDLSHLQGKEKEKATIDAMNRGDILIYSGRLKHKNLLGIPDLLKKEKNGYIPGDIKSGAGEETSPDHENKTPKKHYAVQVALYTDILEQTGFLSRRTPFIWDVKGQEIEYNLDLPLSSQHNETLWDLYQNYLQSVKSICLKKLKTTPALSSNCKLCHWRTHCFQQLKKSHDLTLIPELGRSAREKMVGKIKNLVDLAELDISDMLKGKKTVFPGIGAGSLKKYQNRAKLLTNAQAVPIIKGPINLSESEVELFFDIETDPMRDICYLHGFIVRMKQENESEKYFPFFVNDPNETGEEEAFKQAYRFIKSMQPCLIYYYSRYERTVWRKLQQKYPNVTDREEIESIFSPENSVDLYHDIVRSKTEWPTHNYSIKTLAQYLGFYWRDKDPSGASSIEWYNRWVENNTWDIRKRILEYNEDDCRATRVLLDGIRDLVTK